MIGRRAPRRDRHRHDTGRYTALSDEALMAGVAAREPAAIDAFISRFQSRVYGAALAILRDRALAEEAAQDAFLRVWRHADAFDPRRGSVTGWLMRITRNVAVDITRVRRPVAVDPTELLDVREFSPPGPGRRSAQGASDVANGPEATTIRVDQVRSALAGLPREQSRALLLAAFYGYTAAEVADIEDVPLGTAKTRIRLGLAKVRSATPASVGRAGSGDEQGDLR